MIVRAPPPAERERDRETDRQTDRQTDRDGLNNCKRIKTKPAKII